MARVRSRLRLEPLTVFGMPIDGPVGAGLIPITGQQWFVDPDASVAPWKKAAGTGKGEDRPFLTLAEALAACQTGDTIFITGNIREEALIGSNLKFDVKIVGVGGLHHPDQPSAAYHPGSSMIRPPASPTATTPLISLRGRGWQFHNVVFDAPVDYAAVYIVNNGGSGTSEYDGGHAVFRNCLFRQGKYGILMSDATHNLLVDGCEFFLINASGNGVAIYEPNASVALGLKNTVRNSIFSGTSSAGANDQHIVAKWQGSHIYNNIFGTVTSTGKYIDLTGGNDNIVCKNVLGGAYTTGDYVAGTNDLWLGNWVTVVSTQAPNGYTILPPAA